MSAWLRILSGKACKAANGHSSLITPYKNCRAGLKGPAFFYLMEEKWLLT
jgi:hypothetical protein